MGYRAYPEMRDSGVEWIKRIPAHWHSKRLKFSVSLINEKVEAESSELSYMGLEHIESWSGKRIKDSAASSEGVATKFLPKDVLFGKLRPYLAKVHLASHEGLASTEALILRSQPGASEAYLRYFLVSKDFINIVDSSTYGSKMPRASWDFIGNLLMLLPSINEQQTIARFLDHKTAQIDALIAKKEALLQKLAEKRTALISQAVTRGLDPTVPMKDSGVAWLGKTPAHWEVKRQRFLIGMNSGMTPNTGTPEFWDGNIPWVSPKDMKTEWISGSIDTLTDEALAQTAIQTFASGHVLIVVRGMILAHSFPVAINTLPVTINQDMKAISTTLEPAYLAILLRGMKDVILSLVEEAAHGTKVMRTDLFKNIRLPVPPSAEQKTIVDAVKRVVDETDLMVKRVSSAIEKLKEYRAALITAAVTGKIDVRGVPLPVEVSP